MRKDTELQKLNEITEWVHVNLEMLQAREGKGIAGKMRQKTERVYHNFFYHNRNRFVRPNKQNPIVHLWFSYVSHGFVRPQKQNPTVCVCVCRLVGICFA